MRVNDSPTSRVKQVELQPLSKARARNFSSMSCRGYVSSSKLVSNYLSFSYQKRSCRSGVESFESIGVLVREAIYLPRGLSIAPEEWGAVA